MEGAILDNVLQELPEFVDWLTNNEELLWWLAASSLLVFVASLMLVPWLIVRIPADYFLGEDKRRSILRITGTHPFIAALLKVLRNILGIVFVVLGLLLLVLPGQGLLTILIGLAIADFPGKRRVVNWLVAHRSVHRPLNWLRQRAGKKPLTLS